MASALIHMVVANEVNKKLNKDNDQMLIGSIAPDISKQIGENKVRSHFLDSEGDLPNIDKFLNKYKNNLDDSFVMGYFIHLYTDYLWFKYFIPEICDKNVITKLDGTKVKCTENMIIQYIYNDYSNLNSRLLDEYDMDLHIFYENIPKFQNIIEEIPMDKIQIIIDKVSIIIQNSKERKDFVFDLESVKNFISLCVELINAKIEEINKQ